MPAEKRRRLRDLPKDVAGAVVAFSGGADSTFLVYEARQVLGERVLAVTASSPIHPREEVERARWLAREIGVEHVVLATSELELRLRLQPSRAVLPMQTGPAGAPLGGGGEPGTGLRAGGVQRQ